MSDPPWAVPAPPDRIVAVGDIHGDLDALLRILQGTGLIDARGQWAGRGCHLVLLGDLVDRGTDSVAVMSYVMDLQRQAAQAGDRLDALLGNHELMVVQGEYHYMRAAEAATLADFRHGALRGPDAVFRGESPWARWLRGRPTLLKVGQTAFVHGGPDERLLALSPEAVNEAMRAWVTHLQGAGPEPGASTAWLLGLDGEGPLWTRALMVSRRFSGQAVHTRRLLEAVLAHWGAERLVAGHSPTAALDFAIAWPHPAGGARAAVVDTGICRLYGGRLSALEIAGERIWPLYFERGEAELALTEALRGRYEQARRALSA